MQHIHITYVEFMKRINMNHILPDTGYGLSEKRNKVNVIV